jgi:hypothetical protein
VVEHLLRRDGYNLPLRQSCTSLLLVRLAFGEGPSVGRYYDCFGSIYTVSPPVGRLQVGSAVALLPHVRRRLLRHMALYSKLQRTYVLNTYVKDISHILFLCCSHFPFLFYLTSSSHSPILPTTSPQTLPPPPSTHSLPIPTKLDPSSEPIFPFSPSAEVQHYNTNSDTKYLKTPLAPSTARPQSETPHSCSGRRGAD